MDNKQTLETNNTVPMYYMYKGLMYGDQPDGTKIKSVELSEDGTKQIAQCVKGTGPIAIVAILIVLLLAVLGAVFIFGKAKPLYVSIPTTMYVQDDGTLVTNIVYTDGDVDINVQVLSPEGMELTGSYSLRAGDSLGVCPVLDGYFVEGDSVNCSVKLTAKSGFSTVTSTCPVTVEY